MELLKAYPLEYVLPLGIYNKSIDDINKNAKQVRKKKNELFNNLVNPAILRAKKLENEGLLTVEIC